MPNTKINVFIAFAPADTALKNELEEHLSILQRQEIIHVWHNQKIEAGENIGEKQAEALQNAQIVLLLISSDFLASDSAYENEVLKALERHNQGQARVIPVILRDCLWKTGTLGQLAPLPTGGLPVTEWDNPDSAFKNIAAEIQKIAARFSQQNGNWVYSLPNNISNAKKPVNKWLAAIVGMLAIAIGIIAGVTYQNKATEAKQENDKIKLLNNLQGDWVNPKPDDTYIHRLQFRENYVGVYSLGATEEIYWGEQELQVLNDRKCKVDYEGLTFDLEVVKSTIFDTLVESLIAIYRIDTPGILGLRNSKLLRENTLQLLAMRDPNKSTSRTDSAKFILKSDRVVNLKDLNLTPRMIIDISSMNTDTAQTRIKTEFVSKVIKARQLNLQPKDSVKLNTAPSVKDAPPSTHLKDANIKANQLTSPAVKITNKPVVSDTAVYRLNRPAVPIREGK